MVHSSVCRSLRTRLSLWFSARRLAIWIGRGGLVCGRVTALVGRGALKVICYPLRGADIFSIVTFVQPGD